MRFLAMGIFLAAGISDVLDGYIARTRNMQTKLGSFLDPMADKLLLSASFIVLAFAHSVSFKIRLPIWVLILFISRDMILALGSLLVHLTTSNLKIEPSIWGKLTTFFQMATVIAILLQFSYSFLLWDIAAVITVASGLDYIYKSNKLLSAGK